MHLGRRENKSDVCRRLFEGLEQGVKRRPGEHVHLIDDVDLAAGCLRQVADLVAKVANIVDAVVARTVDLDDIDTAALGDRNAFAAHVAGLGGRAVDAHQAFCQQAGRGCFAEPARAAKEVGVVDPIVGDRVAQGAGDVLLADQVSEGLRPVFPG